MYTAHIILMLVIRANVLIFNPCNYFFDYFMVLNYNKNIS